METDSGPKDDNPRPAEAGPPGGHGGTGRHAEAGPPGGGPAPPGPEAPWLARLEEARDSHPEDPLERCIGIGRVLCRTIGAYLRRLPQGGGAILKEAARRLGVSAAEARRMWEFASDHQSATECRELEARNLAYRALRRAAAKLRQVRPGSQREEDVARLRRACVRVRAAIDLLAPPRD